MEERSRDLFRLVGVDRQAIQLVEPKAGFAYREPHVLVQPGMFVVVMSASTVQVMVAQPLRLLRGSFNVTNSST
ncbi:MAG: hypothetical protein ACREM1_12960 [Longimicrobiales bacterium]